MVLDLQQMYHRLALFTHGLSSPSTENVQKPISGYERSHWQLHLDSDNSRIRVINRIPSGALQL